MNTKQEMVHGYLLYGGEDSWVMLDQLPQELVAVDENGNEISDPLKDTHDTWRCMSSGVQPGQTILTSPFMLRLPKGQYAVRYLAEPFVFYVPAVQEEEIEIEEDPRD